VEAFSDTGIVGMLDDKLRTGLGGVFGPGTTGPAKKEAKKAGGEVGETLGEAINSGAGGAADGESWVKKWTDKVVSVLEKELDKIRKSAADALDKTHEAALKVYDDRIKAIEDQEKAEEKLYKTEEYLANKRNLLAKRNIDRQNYQNERSIALYEGRYNDVRMLDLKEQSDKRAYSDDLTGIEDSRAKDLLKETRDGLKDIINLEKDAAKERFDFQKKALEAYLDQILEMTPLTVAEMQSAMDRINQVLGNAGAAWPEYARGAMDVFTEVFRKSNAEIVNDFRKSGQDAVLDWVAGFVSTDALAAIKAELSKSGGGGGGGTDGTGGGTDGGGDSAEGEPAPSGGDAKTSFEEQQKKYKEAKTIFDKDFHKDKKDPLALGTNAFKKEASADDTRDVSASNQAEQDLIDIIKEQIQRGDTRNQGLEEYRKAMGQLKADAYATYHTLSSEEMKAHKQIMTNVKEKIVGQNAVFSSDNRAVDSIRKMTDEVKFHTDKSGVMYKQVGDRMVDSYGQSYKILRDEHGNMTNNIVDNNGKITKINEKTFTSAQAVWQEMTDKGIKPGTAAAADYIKKINDLGGAVYELPDGKTIVIDADTSKLYEAIKRVNKFFELNNKAGGGYVSLDFVDLIAQTGSVQGAIDYVAGPDLSFLNDPGIRAALGLASGGLVKAQKDGIIANIGEGGFDEYVITTDPKYRASNLGYLSAAASKLGVKMASGAAIKAASGGMFTSRGASGSSAEYASGMGGDVYINVDTFIGEEEWFASMANKYNMKTVPRQRKIEGQQKRVVSSYNDRYRLR
jgi:hypothetical protein